MNYLLNLDVRDCCLSFSHLVNLTHLRTCHTAVRQARSFPGNKKYNADVPGIRQYDRLDAVNYLLNLDVDSGVVDVANATGQVLNLLALLVQKCTC